MFKGIPGITGNKDTDILICLKFDNETLLNMLSVFKCIDCDTFWRCKLVQDFPKRSIGFLQNKNCKDMYNLINQKSRHIFLSRDEYPEIYEREKNFDIYSYNDLLIFVTAKIKHLRLFRGDTIFLSSIEFYDAFYWDGEKVIDEFKEFSFPEFSLDHFNCGDFKAISLSKEKINEAIFNFPSKSNKNTSYITHSHNNYIVKVKSSKILTLEEFSNHIFKYPYIVDYECIIDSHNNIEKIYLFNEIQ
jgi:hypothetical protein